MSNHSIQQYLLIIVQVVREDSATFEYPDCNNIPMQRDHKLLNKFIDQDTDYTIVLKAITRCIERTGKYTSSKQDIEG
jgi:hypothetical protein